SPRLENNDQPIISSNPTNAIPNTPILTPNNVIELNAVGMGVAPESTISPSQALALAKRAAIVDGYRQLGEKMYGIRVNAQDTVKDMVLQNSVIKTRVNALIRNAEITETIYKDGLCQVSMELKLDGRIWYRILSGSRG
ncbi:LPP20 family lipoprotein, partial [Helicobacter pylori]